MTADPEQHAFGDDELQVVVAAQGAELQSVRRDGVGEVLWNGGPAWPRRSPVLFPIVGRLADDTLRMDGRTTRLGQHGFARDRRFRWESRDGRGCRLVVEDDAETRAVFPRPFRLELAYTVEGGVLTTAYRVTNPGRQPLHVSLGAHPGFRWPLSPRVASSDHFIRFAEPEPEPLLRLRGGLVRPEPRPSPVEGRILRLDRSLFLDDALIFDQIASRSLEYVAPGYLTLEMNWSGFSQLGVWSPPGGGGFVCIEPWRGRADAEGFSGDVSHRPAVVSIPPAGEFQARWSINVLTSNDSSSRPMTASA